MPSQILQERAAVEDQSVMAPPETPQSEPDVKAEAFDFITRHVLETDAIMFEG